MIYALRDFGAHFNPAVSLAIWLSGHPRWPGEGWPPLAPSVKPMGAELLYTTMLCFTVLRAACAPSPWSNYEDNEYFGLAIGLTIVAAGYAVGSISGAVLNPAAAFGLDVVVGGSGWLAYASVQVLAAGCAAGLNR